MMARRTEPGSEDLYAASRRIVDAAFRADDSILTPGAPIWTAANIAELRQRFVENPDEGKDKFEEKLRKQDVRVEIDCARQTVLVLSRLSETEWQTNSRVPAGLSAGVHRVRLRTVSSRYSEEREIEFRPD